MRVAGNVVGPLELDSINYSIKNLGANLIVILGHEACGAVTAVLEGKAADIPAIATLIKPAIQGRKNVKDAVKANVQWVVTNLKKSKTISKLVLEKKIDCIGAYYDLSTGQVEILK